MKNYYILTALLAALCVSCEKAVDIDVPFENPKLVLNGFLNPDSSISVHVSKSQFILDESDLKNIEDARVTVYEGDQLLGELQHQGFGFYKLDGVVPETGKIYTIQAERNGLATVIAQHPVLDVIQPQNIKIDTLQFDEYGQRRMSLEFSIEDPAEQDNYYFLKVFEKGEGMYVTWEGDTIRESYITSPILESTDPILEQMCPGWSGCGLLVSGSYFDGKSYRMKVSTNGGFGYGYGYERENVEVYLAVYHVPESFYLFYKTLENNRNTSGNPFAEPAKVFTNVEGGYGLWTSLSPALLKIK